MTLDDLVAYFGSGSRACKEIGIKPQNYSQWKKIGYIPEFQQYRFEKFSKGRLKAEKVVLADFKDKNEE